MIEPSLAKFNAALLVKRAAQFYRQVEQEADPEAAEQLLQKATAAYHQIQHLEGDTDGVTIGDRIVKAMFQLEIDEIEAGLAEIEREMKSCKP
jgi:hypothetical protein